MNEEKKVKNTGGLYAKIKMPLKTANIMVAVLIAALILVTAFIIGHSGFTVDFDTDGGSHIESINLKHSDKISLSKTPVKEGYKFAGWYKDKALTQEWDFSDGVEGSMTLYAKWIK